MYALVLIVAIAAACLPRPASATSQGQWTLSRWKAMDLCTKQAQQAFPDFSAEANAKRETALRKCLGNNNLPPRD